jgi:hypothetical protein
MAEIAEPNNHRQGTTCRRTDDPIGTATTQITFPSAVQYKIAIHLYYTESRYKSQNQIFIDRARLAAGQMDSLGTATTQNDFSSAVQYDRFQS